MTSRFRTPENAERICALIAEGYTLRQVAREVGVESASAITNWVREDEGFHAQYAKAKALQAERMAEDLLDIADDSSNDWMEREGHQVVNGEALNRSRLRVDTRKWLLSKMLPKVYGERASIEHTGKDGGAIEMSIEDKRVAARALLDGVFGAKE